MNEEAIANISKHIPEYMVSSVVRYVDDGAEPGKFLRAVLENKLVQAYVAADSNNAAAMQGWATVLYNYIPAALWGDSVRVDAHIDACAIARAQLN